MRKNLFLTLLVIMASFTITFAQNRSGDELYTQMLDGYSTWDYVYSFEELWGDPAYDTYGADDFEVPAGETWEIASVKSVMKTYDVVTTMNVVFYSDDNGAPGTELHRFDDVSTNNVINMPEYGVFEIETMLPSNVSLTEGIYWISISADAQNDYWQWLYQMNTTTNLSQTHVINPGGGMYLPTEWTPNVNYSGYYNATFALYAPPVPNDLTITAINSPESGEMTAEESIEVIIANVGALEQSTYDIQYQINDGDIVVETVDIIIGSNESITYTFATTADMLEVGDYVVSVTALLDTDENNGNDNFTESFHNYGTIYEISGDTTSYTACSGLFTDAGGLFNSFTLDDGGIITFTPEYENSRVTLDFSQFDLGNSHQFIIYDGSSNEDNILYKYKEDWHAYNEHTDIPEYIRARNGYGIMTVEFTPTGYIGSETGWVADLGCVIPAALDFTALNLTAEGLFYHKDMPVTVTARVTNSGLNYYSREVYLYEEDELIATATTGVLAPGDIEDIIFTWYPQNMGSDVKLSFDLEVETGIAANDNYQEIFLTVYGQYNITESFESQSLAPEYWTLKVGDFEHNTYNAPHASQYLKSIYNASNDTLVTPLLQIEADDVLSFYASGSNKLLEILYSEDINGPWTVLTDYDNQLSYSWAQYDADLSSLAGNQYYLAFAIKNTGPYSGNFSIDFVVGPSQVFNNKDLKVYEIEVNKFPTIGREAQFSVSVKNTGLETVEDGDYSVHLMSATDSEILATYEGYEMDPWEIIEYNFFYTFSDDVITEIYFEIEYADDQDQSTNISAMSEIFIQPEGTFNYILPGDEMLYPQPNFPIANNSKYGLSEFILYPEEIQAQGTLSAFTFKYIATNPLPYVPIKIWMGTTQDSILTDWVIADSLTLVFDGLVDFNSVEFTELFLLLDTPFEYNGEDNLIIMIDKDFAGITGAVKFSMLEKNIYYRGYNIYSNAADIDPNAPDPNLYLQRFDDVPWMRFFATATDFPQFTSEPLTYIGENQYYEYTAEVTYEGENELSLLEGDYFPNWLNLTDNGDKTVTLSGTTDVLGDYPVQILATDGVTYATQSYILTIAAVPVFVGEPDTLISEYNNYNYEVIISYSGDDPVIITAEYEGNWLSIADFGDNTGILYGYPDETGDFAVQVIATGDYITTTKSYIIHVGAVPEITSEPVTIIDFDQVYTYEITVDYNSEEVCEIVAVNELPSWLTLTDNGDNTATLTGQPVDLNSYGIEIIALGEYYTDEQAFTLDVIVGIPDKSENKIDLYPNPATNYVFINGMNGAEISIMDISGRVVKNTTIHSDNERIDVSDLQNGIYMIHALLENNISVEKLIVNN